MRSSYEFVQLDVFTRTSLAGNPLAIFPDARGLSDKQMQALTREMNLSETTFILPRDGETEHREGKKVRIFTVREELPFAGHPTLGTALHLRATNGAPDEIVLSEVSFLDTTSIHVNTAVIQMIAESRLFGD